MATLTVRPSPVLRGTVRVPGDKSVSHRSVLLAALAEGVTTVQGFLASEDCLASLEAVRALGAEVEAGSTDGDGRPEDLRVTGTGGRLTAPGGPIDCGNSGTTMRLLSGVLAGQDLEAVLTGDASLSRRPMNRVATPLALMGALVEGQGGSVTAPLRIRGTATPRPIHYVPPVASAQVKSAVLLCGLGARGRTAVVEPLPTRDHTERMLGAFGVSVTVSTDDRGRREVWLEGPVRLVAPGAPLQVPADISGAAFWLVAAAGGPGSQVTLPRVGINPTRAGVLHVLHRMGAAVEVLARAGEDGEPWADLRVNGSVLQGTVIEGAEIPNVIDELPVLAVAGALAEGVTEIRDAAELRVKESDRIALVVRGLRAMGAQVEELADGLRVVGGRALRGARVDSEGDHRIAMAFAVAGLHADGDTVVTGAEAIATSYPTFERDLLALTADAG